MKPTRRPSVSLVTETGRSYDALNGALPGPYVPVQATRGALVAHRSTCICATSLQNLAVPQDFCSPLSVPLE